MRVAELKQRLEKNESTQLIDVREPIEWEFVRLEDARHIPLGAIAEKFGELDPEAYTVVYCHHGIRSAQAAEFLRRQGFKDVHNLEGGIDEWSIAVDPTKPRYG